MPDCPAPEADDRRFAEDLQAAATGDLAARNRLWADHYDTLHDCCRAWLASNWQRRGDAYGVSLSGTDILHAAYARLRDRTAAMVHGRAFFFRVFYTECMRIVVDHYRKTKNDKGRGQHQRVEFQSQFLDDQRVGVELDRLYEILAELGEQSERTGLVAMMKVLESRPDERQQGRMRGLTNQEVADALELGLRTVEKEWAFAKAWLLKRLGEETR
jgi:RNA polymerase sigma factor (TIGR02999 family)